MHKSKNPVSWKSILTSPTWVGILTLQAAVVVSFFVWGS